MKKLLFLLWLMGPVATFGQTTDTTDYHYNKVYDYENDTVPVSTYYVDSLLHFAGTFIGTPYVSPGRSPKGFDCSGFTFYCYRAYGVYLPYTAHEQADLGEKDIPVSEAQAGDLIFFQGYNLTDKSVHHVGLVVSKKGERLKFIHSSSHGVHYEYLDSPYYHPRFIRIRRVR